LFRERRNRKKRDLIVQSRIEGKAITPGNERKKAFLEGGEEIGLKKDAARGEGGGDSA